MSGACDKRGHERHFVEIFNPTTGESERIPINGDEVSNNLSSETRKVRPNISSTEKAALSDYIKTLFQQELPLFSAHLDDEV